MLVIVVVLGFLTVVAYGLLKLIGAVSEVKTRSAGVKFPIHEITKDNTRGIAHWKYTVEPVFARLQTFKIKIDSQITVSNISGPGGWTGIRAGDWVEWSTATESSEIPDGLTGDFLFDTSLDPKENPVPFRVRIYVGLNVRGYREGAGSTFGPTT